MLQDLKLIFKRKKSEKKEVKYFHRTYFRLDLFMYNFVGKMTNIKISTGVVF